MCGSLKELARLLSTMTANGTSTTPPVRIKLLIDMRQNKVLFAESGKDFVDFLFSLFALPVCTAVSLLEKDASDMAGSLGNLSKSVGNLCLLGGYMQPNINKVSILQPNDITAPSYNTTSLPLLLTNGQMPQARLFTCSSTAGKFHPDCAGFVSSDPNVTCPKCNKHYMSKKVMTWVGAPQAGKVGLSNMETGGYVKGLATYIVTDDLVVHPQSAISSIAMLKKCNVKDVGVLVEKVVEVDTAEGLKLMKESLSSQTVLSNVFLGKPSAAHRNN